MRKRFLVAALVAAGCASTAYASTLNIDCEGEQISGAVVSPERLVLISNGEAIVANVIHSGLDWMAFYSDAEIILLIGATDALGGGVTHIRAKYDDVLLRTVSLRTGLQRTLSLSCKPQ